MRDPERPLLRFLPLLVLLAAVLAQVSLIDDAPMTWSGDAPQYILHARNLVEGTPYAETGYVQNPYFFLAPVHYPPGFPLLLAPVYAVFGPDVLAMKVYMSFWFVVMLTAGVWLFHRDLPTVYLGIVAALIGFSPFLMGASSYRIFSDIPFTCLILLSLIGLERTNRLEASDGMTTGRRLRGRGGPRGNAPRRGVMRWKMMRWDVLGWGVLTGLCMFMAVLTRSLGIVLLPVPVGFALLRDRRLLRPALVVTGVALLSFAAYAVAFNPGLPIDEASGYGRLIETSVPERGLGLAATAMARAADYYFHLRRLWSNGWDAHQARSLLFGCSLLLAVAGFTYRVLRRPSPVELFVLLYGAALLPWSFSEARYLMPVLPMYLFYVVVGAERAASYAGRRSVKSRSMVHLVLASLLVGAVVSYGSTFVMHPVETPASDPTAEAAQEVFRFIRERTPADALVIFRKPRFVALYSDRKASAYHEAPDDEMLSYFDEIGASYVLLAGEELFPDDVCLEALLLRHPDRFGPVFDNGRFRLYERR